MARISRRSFGKRFIASAALTPALNFSMPNNLDSQQGRRPSLTDIDGILVGHFTHGARPTGCTVVLTREPCRAGVDVRGGAPGTRETDLLRPENVVEKVDAIFLSGGSAFGLGVAAGVEKYLEEQGRGFAVGKIRVPIICGAILFDLGLGDPAIRPGAEAGYEAARNAGDDAVAEGNKGAGAGATVGKLLGMERAMKGGLGSWAIRRPDGLQVGALVAVNAMGDIVDPATGKIVAGARNADGTGFADSMAHLRLAKAAPSGETGNTVIGVVATNAPLSKVQCHKVAQMAHDGLARSINPAHMPWDGDTVFAIATGAAGAPADPGIVGALAADVLATAVLRAVRAAESWGAYPAARDYPARP